MVTTCTTLVYVLNEKLLNFICRTLKMREIGAMNKLINAHLDLKFVPESVLNPVMFALIWYLVVMSGVGVVLSLIVCLIECFIWRLNSRGASCDKIGKNT